ncbi:hypothetical protein Bca52824_081228 [Brassica carinata]|uniref:Uncharacterized protein n=1 Tax=Brassica carinata TaxID=52824 RepID=A0A8X7PHL7_BRACI|nr:hypothetical protein Bca52824_081228 [Brassica carinata]
MIQDMWQLVILIMAQSVKMTAKCRSTPNQHCFFVEAANPPRRKICVVSPNDRDHVDIATANDRMFDEFYRKIDAIYFPLSNSIASLSQRMEELELKVEYTHEIIQRQQEHITR